MSVFNDKVLLITGGTGSFGNAVLRRFLDSDIKEIRIFSRDEKKQDDMRHRLQNPKVKFYIGNVRNKQSVDIAMRGVDYVFSAAALKQVPSCEFFPMEATRTISHQRDGHLEGPDGEGRDSQGPRAGRGRRHDHLLHALRQRNGQPRQRDTAVGGADDGGPAHYHHGPEHDALHDDP